MSPVLGASEYLPKLVPRLLMSMWISYTDNQKIHNSPWYGGGTPIVQIPATTVISLPFIPLCLELYYTVRARMLTHSMGNKMPPVRSPCFYYLRCNSSTFRLCGLHVSQVTLGNKISLKSFFRNSNVLETCNILSLGAIPNILRQHMLGVTFLQP